MRKEGLRLKCYRQLQRNLIQKMVLPRFFSAERMAAGRTPHEAVLSPDSKRAWFHAASVGELESLWTLIAAWVEQGREAIVTVFSESARGPIQKLRDELSGRPGKVVYIGYSPWEGGWRESLGALRPSVFVSAKYEAWPELWASLSELKIPLVIAGARARSSLRVAKNLCLMLGRPLPPLTLLTATDHEDEPLRRLFPRARVRCVGESRWDRVEQRLKKGNPRARELVALCSGLPRPWGVLGSAWRKDLELWGKNIGALPGTYWIVPHKVDSQSIPEIRGTLSANGIRFTLSSELKAQTAAESVILVDEMGILSELYGSADWSYVGGGFGDGVHSTIEPAIAGIPVAAGPNGAAAFPEIRELAASGQLRIVRGARDLEEWIAQLPAACAPESRKRWQEQARGRLGATSRALQEVWELAQR